MFGQAGAAALDRVEPGAGGGGQEVDAEQAGHHEQQPDDEEVQDFSSHGSVLEGLVDGHEGGGCPAVVDNVPIRRGAARGHVFGAGKAPFHPVRRMHGAPLSPDGGQRNNYRKEPGTAAVGAGCGWAGLELHLYPRGPADRAVAVRAVR